jgi:hypothetical protein
VPFALAAVTLARAVLTRDAGGVQEEDEDSDTLSIVALIAGIAGLAAGWRQSSGPAA